jgi:hypothetical protein
VIGPRIPWGIAFLVAVFLLGLCVAPDRADGGGGQRCGPYESACLQAMVDFGFGYDPELLAYIHDTIHCESRFNPSVRGHVDPRDRGLVQINSFWHPNVSDAEAFDPVFSIRYMVWHWSRGNASQWACYVGLRDRFGPPAALRVAPSTAALARLADVGPVLTLVVMAPPRWLADLLRLLSQQSQPVAPPFWAWGGFP